MRESAGSLGVLGGLVLTFPKVLVTMVILGTRGEGLRVRLVVDELSMGVYAIILPLFLLSLVWPVGMIERVN